MLPAGFEPTNPASERRIKQLGGGMRNPPPTDPPPIYQVQLQTLDDEISTSARGHIHYVTTPPSYILLSNEKPDDGQ